jgi:hypothetical protein
MILTVHDGRSRVKGRWLQVTLGNYREARLRHGSDYSLISRRVRQRVETRAQDIDSHEAAFKELLEVDPDNGFTP